MAHRRSLLPILTEAREREGFLSEAAVREIGRLLELTDNEVFGVASFYPWFRFAPTPGTEPAVPSPSPVVPAVPEGDGVVVCNAARGAPVDRLLLEDEPEAVVQGLAAVARQLGFDRVVIWVDVDWPTAAERVGRAVAALTEEGLVVDVVRVPGAYMHREESAFLRAFEGRRPIAERLPEDPKVAVFTAEALAGKSASDCVEEAPADACVVARTARSLDFLARNLCGKCAVCREGTMQMAEVLRDIAEGKGKAGDVDLLVELGEALASTGSCALGRAAPNAVLSTIRSCRDEYEAHVCQKMCLSGGCTVGRDG